MQKLTDAVDAIGRAFADAGDQADIGARWMALSRAVDNAATAKLQEGGYDVEEVRRALDAYSLTEEP